MIANLQLMLIFLKLPNQFAARMLTLTNQFAADAYTHHPICRQASFYRLHSPTNLLLMLTYYTHQPICHLAAMAVASACSCICCEIDIDGSCQCMLLLTSPRSGTSALDARGCTDLARPVLQWIRRLHNLLVIIMLPCSAAIII
jgi:hypothetical protein